MLRPWAVLALLAGGAGGCAAPSVESDTRARVLAAAAAWERGDADWDARRDVIEASGDLATRHLAETMFVLSVRQWEGDAGRLPGDQDRARRTAAEIATLGPAADSLALRALGEGAGAVRVLAEEVLRARGVAAEAGLLEKYRRPGATVRQRKTLVRALGLCGGEGAASALIATVRGEGSWELRAAAVEGLALMKGPLAEEGLRAALEDTDGFVRKQAVRVLGEQGTSASRAALRRALRRAGDHGNQVESNAIRMALRRIAEREPFGEAPGVLNPSGGASTGESTRARG